MSTEPRDDPQDPALLAYRGALLLSRRIGYQIGEAAIDLRILRPDRGIETARQTGLKLLGRQASDARIVFRRAGTLRKVRYITCGSVPVIGIDIASTVNADQAASPVAVIATSHRCRRIRF